MTLAELCDPIFSTLCLLNRGARLATAPGFDQARAEFIRMIDDARRKAQADPVLSGEFRKVEEQLIVLVDNLISTGDLPYAQRWHTQRLAHELLDPPVHNGEGRFFERLDETLADRSANANDRLLFYYICLGLGFAQRGPLPPEMLHEKMQVVAARLRDRIDFDAKAKLFPKAYEELDERDLTRSIRAPLRRTVILSALGLVAIFAGLWIAVWWNSGALTDHLARLEKDAAAVDPVSRTPVAAEHPMP